ncbi:D-alanyl-D-alanine carboxypeptidase [Actinobacteria bacterium IMCC26207]|nr:D-alanyl-D-alanine carboxypeptidase [Actinobacteria bacterium IMCC26207]
MNTSLSTSRGTRSVALRARTRLFVALAATASVALIGTTALPASAATGALTKDDNPSLAELQTQRAAVQQKAAGKASQVNALKASDAQVSSALSALNTNVNAQQDRLEEAERAVAQAQADQAAAEAAQSAKQSELDALTAQMKESAVDAYVSMGSANNISVGTDDINDTVNKRTLMSVRANEDIGLVEKFRSVQEDLEIQRGAAAAANTRATAGAEQVEGRLNELNKAYAEQQAFAAKVEARLNSALAEADSLAATNAQLSSSITSKQAEIAKAVAAQRAADSARAAQRAAQSKPAVSASGSGGGSSSGGDSGGGGGGGGAPPDITGSGEIVNVGGIRIHQSMAGNLQSLLAAASAAGINFGGGGYRDPAGQIAVRRNNCGSSNYAIYEMPASSCSPPSARPGTSMHERGLAVDFTQGGSTLSRGSSGFAWMRANASSYGFFNLPSEPWHWSSNGN